MSLSKSVKRFDDPTVCTVAQCDTSTMFNCLCKTRESFFYATFALFLFLCCKW